MIGILGGMGTQAGLDFCNKLAKINAGKLDQQYPMFVLYNKSNIPKRPENLKKYYNVLDSLVEGCKMLQKNNCKFIVMPCNTAHYWYDDLRKKVKIPILSMPKEVYLDTSKNCKKNSKIGILGGMGTQAGLDFCNKLAKINAGKLDQQYPMFVLYNKSNIPKRPENLKKYYNVLDSLVEGCKMLQKNNCKFIVMPCNTAHYWYDDLRKKVKIPILSMPKEVYLDTSKNCKKNSKIGILSTEATLSTKVYNKYFDKNFNLVSPNKSLQKNSVNKSIKLVKMGKIKEAEKAIRPAVSYLMKIKCKKIILGCTELPIAIFAYKSFKKIKQSKVFVDPNLLLANISMKKYKRF